MAKITLGILGLGTVGTGVIKLLSDDPRFRIKWVAVRDKTKAREVDLSSVRLTEDPMEIVRDPEVEIVIEVAGGIKPIFEVIRSAVEQGKHVVTANKELIAKHGSELFDLANHHNVTILFEAAVGGGIPLISTIQRGLEANEISSVAGILNGTTNYILTEMDERGQSFDEALAGAQRLGFAESDPTNDVEGFDVAYKITILASLAFGRFVDTESVYRQGISAVTDLDMKTAREFGYRVKMIGLARRGEGCLDVRAHPMLVPSHHLLASVEGANNAIFISGDAVGEVMLVRPRSGPDADGKRGRGGFDKPRERAEAARFRALLSARNRRERSPGLLCRRDGKRVLHPPRNPGLAGRDRQHRPRAGRPPGKPAQSCAAGGDWRGGRDHHSAHSSQPRA